MKPTLALAIALIGTALHSHTARGADADDTAPSQPEALVRAQLLADVDAVVPGQPFTLGVLYNIQPRWHIYWKYPGSSGLATTINFAAPESLSIGELLWPVPRGFVVDGDATYGYENQVLLMARVQTSRDLKPGDTLTINASTEWLSCKESCVLGNATLTLTMPVKEKSQRASAAIFDTWQAALPIAATDKRSPFLTRVVGRWNDEQHRGSFEVQLLLKDGAARPRKAQLACIPEADQAVVFGPIAYASDDVAAGDAPVSAVTFPAKILEGLTPKGESAMLLVLTAEDGERVGIRVPIPLRDSAAPPPDDDR